MGIEDDCACSSVVTSIKVSDHIPGDHVPKLEISPENFDESYIREISIWLGRRYHRQCFVCFSNIRHRIERNVILKMNKR